MADLKLYNGTESQIVSHDVEEGAIYVSTDTNVMRYDSNNESHYVGQEIFVGDENTSESELSATTNLWITPINSEESVYIPYIADDKTSKFDTWSSSKIKKLVQISSTEPTDSDCVLWIQP